MAHTLQVGFFGKLPTLGDFLSRRLEPAFIESWDRWLQQALTQAREQLGAAWVSHYESAAPWRFALDAGVCGAEARLGVLIACRDRVGRQFPLTVACALPPGCGALAAACSAGAWYQDMEQLLLAQLHAPMAVEAFDQAVEQSAAPLAASVTLTEAADLQACQQILQQHGAFRLPLSAQGLDAALASMAASQLAGAAAPLAALWCEATAAPTLFASRGLPAPALFTEMLRLPRLAALSPTSAAVAPPISAARASESAGRWQFAAMANPQPGAALAVAAAIGSDEAVRERLTQLGALLREPPLSDAALLDQLNVLLLGPSAAAGGVGAMNLAACVPRAADSLFVWSGGAAVFRLRGRELTRLSPLPDAAGIVDAVGAGSLLELLQQAPAQSHPGAGVLQTVPAGGIEAEDRYLLCSDATYSALSWGQLVSALSESTPAFAVGRLREAVGVRAEGAAPALVLMYEAGTAGAPPRGRAATTVAPVNESLAPPDQAPVNGSVTACC